MQSGYDGRQWNPGEPAGSNKGLFRILERSFSFMCGLHVHDMMISTGAGVAWMDGRSHVVGTGKAASCGSGGGRGVAYEAHRYKQGWADGQAEGIARFWLVFIISVNCGRTFYIVTIKLCFCYLFLFFITTLISDMGHQ